MRQRCGHVVPNADLFRRPAVGKPRSWLPAFIVIAGVHMRDGEPKLARDHRVTGLVLGPESACSARHAASPSWLFILVTSSRFKPEMSLRSNPASMADVQNLATSSGARTMN